MVPTRVLHLISHPAQYYVPLYRMLSGRRGLELTVGFYCDAQSLGLVGDDFNTADRWDIPLTTGYRYRFFGGGAGRRWANRLRLAASVAPYLLRERFDVVWIAGYSTLTAALAVFLGHLTGARVVIMDDATLLDHRSRIRLLVKRVILPRLFRKIRAVYAGSHNRRFFRRYGVNDGNLFFAPHSVDNAFFRRQTSPGSAAKGALRGSFGLPEDAPVVLFCGKLVSRKDPLTLLKAFSLVRAEHRCSLLMVGDGPLRRQLEQVVLAEGIRDVRFSGFLNQTEISRAYAASDLLVLPSKEGETWGLVVNEAMNFSLPVIVSDRVGCAGDLVVPNENGYVFPAGRVEALAGDIQQLVSDRTTRERFGFRSLRMIDDWDISRTAAGVVEACYAGANQH